jgi:predicted nucleic acid-binding protein
MVKKVFIDANIFIDQEDSSRDSEHKSLKVLTHLLNNDHALYTSCDLITTIYYILAKKDKLKALDAVERINKICKIIEFSNSDVNTVCQLMRANPQFTDLEDTMQYALALREKCDLIISNDKNFVSEEIELLSTKQFLTIIKEEL